MYDLTIRLQTNDKKCLYEQIYEHIKQEMKEGKLLAGEKLPSTRSLAEYLQVARTTVEYAYGQLQSEGYIEARPYRGYFVCVTEEFLDVSTSEGQETVVQNPQIEERELPYDFSPNGIDMSGFPFGVWKRISKNILNEENSDLFSQGDHQGDYNLRVTISRYLHSSRGVNSLPEQIVIGAGNDYLLMLLEKILGQNVRIAMENPTYKRAYHIFQSYAESIETVDMDESGIVVSQLRERDVNVAYVMPSHQFPTGIVMPIGRRIELLRWANEDEERYLIEDDYDSEFRYKGKPIPSLQASDEHSKVIYIGTFSKAIAPGIRVSYMVLPLPLLEKYKKECYFYSCTVSRLDQRILDEFIRDGYFERHLNKMRKCYREKHDLLLECLKPFEQKFEISGEHGGLHLLLTAKEKVSEQELREAAAECGVKVYGLSDSMVNPSYKQPTVLLGFGGMENEKIFKGIQRLEKAWLE